MTKILTKTKRMTKASQLRYITCQKTRHRIRQRLISMEIKTTLGSTKILLWTAILCNTSDVILGHERLFVNVLKSDL